MVALQGVTVGSEVTEVMARLEKEGEFAEQLYVHGLGVQSAEGLAEWLHSRARAELKVDAGQGRRYSWGYPACPEQSEHEKVWRLLGLDDIGMYLSDGFAVMPEQSTVAIVAHHPQAVYFGMKSGFIPKERGAGRADRGHRARWRRAVRGRSPRLSLGPQRRYSRPRDRQGCHCGVCRGLAARCGTRLGRREPGRAITSDNVTHLKNIPRHADSSGARKLGNFFYITTGRDVAIYDVSTPEDPELVGELMLPAVAEPAFAEEDVDTNGEILLVENQGTLFVIDVVDKANPVVKSQLNDADVHTISCVLDCRYAYGNNGKIFDLTDPADPKLAMVNWEEKFPTESTHDVTEVAPGVILTASQPMMLLDARTTPLDPTLTGRPRRRTAASCTPRAGPGRPRTSSC